MEHCYKYTHKNNLGFTPPKNTAQFFAPDMSETYYRKICTPKTQSCYKDAEFYTAIQGLFKKAANLGMDPDVNKTPLFEYLDEMWAMGAAGVATVWLREPNDMNKVGEQVRTLMSYNKDVTKVVFKVDFKMYTKKLPNSWPYPKEDLTHLCQYYVTRITDRLEGWRTRACLKYARGETPPFELRMLDFSSMTSKVVCNEGDDTAPEPTPGTPPGPTFSDRDVKSVLVKWVHSNDDTVTKFDLILKGAAHETKPEAVQRSFGKDVPRMEHTVTGLSPGTKYYFFIRAYADDTHYADSKIEEIETVGQLEAPVVKDSDVGSPDSVTMEWKWNPKASGGVSPSTPKPQRCSPSRRSMLVGNISGIFCHFFPAR